MNFKKENPDDKEVTERMNYVADTMSGKKLSYKIPPVSDGDIIEIEKCFPEFDMNKFKELIKKNCSHESQPK